MHDTSLDTDLVLAARPSRMVVMLYEETIASLDRAVEATDRGDMPARSRHAGRAADILDLLYGCLDLQRGGDIASALAGLYRTVLGRLVMLNAGRDARPGREAIGLLAPPLDRKSTRMNSRHKCA